MFKLIMFKVFFGAKRSPIHLGMRKLVVCIWTPYQASLSYAYKVGRSYPAGNFFRAHSKSVDLYFAPTQSALPSSSILKIISVGKCELCS